MAYESRRSNQGTSRETATREPAQRRGNSSPATSASDAARRGFVRIGGLWKHEKNGKQFLSGRIGLAVMFVFKQEKKKNGDPDWALFVAPDQAPSERQAGEREPGEDDL